MYCIRTLMYANQQTDTPFATECPPTHTIVCHHSVCGTKVEALRRTALRKLPPVLIIHLKRFEFDLESMTKFKVRFNNMHVMLFVVGARSRTNVRSPTSRWHHHIPTTLTKPGERPLRLPHVAGHDPVHGRVPGGHGGGAGRGGDGGGGRGGGDDALHVGARWVTVTCIVVWLIGGFVFASEI